MIARPKWVPSQPLHNTRREKFVQGVFGGLSVIEAYAAAGYARTRPNASRLLAQPDVQARLAYLGQTLAREMRVDAELLADQLEEARARAMADKRYSAAVAAIAHRAKLLGLYVEVQSSTVVITDERDMTDDELARIASGRGQRAIEEAGGASEPDRLH